MAITFYPGIDDSIKGTLTDRVELLMEAAERYKAIILDEKSHLNEPSETPTEVKRTTPKDLTAAYNWAEIAYVLRKIRELSEGSKPDKLKKAELLIKLAEVYEVLRAAKMSKLEAVRLALVNEATQLRSGEGSKLT